MKRLMISAPASGSGKTVLTCGLLTAFQDRGISCESFKCGPDYIDPMFHTRVLGVPSRNLDLFLQGEEKARRTLNGQRAEMGLVEGAMGYYDGLNGTDKTSAWEISSLFHIPVILAVHPEGSSLTLAAQLKGILNFRNPCPVRGVIFMRCRESLFKRLKPVVERETGLEVLGYLPPMEEADLPARHLGLITAEEVKDFQERFRAVAAQLEQTVMLDRLLELAGEIQPQYEEIKLPPPDCTIAVARDEAFCFCYEDSLTALKEAGARLEFFSPLHDSCLPDADGLYLCGGYPELYACPLSNNLPLRESIRKKVSKGLPTVAECGGFLYLQEYLQSRDGIRYTMAEVLPGGGVPTEGLVRFGYAVLCPESDSLLFRAGDRIPVHEFHHWDSTNPGTDLQVEKADGSSWRCGICDDFLYAAFPHLHLGGELPLARRFTDAARAYHKEKA